MRALFELNPALDRAALAAAFARDRRVQVRDMLTPETAEEVHRVLMATPWGLAVNPDGRSRGIRHAELRAMPQAERNAIGAGIARSVQQGGYGFVYHHYPMVTAYTERWAPDGAHDLLIEYLNAEPMLGLVRDVTGMPGLLKADGSATLFAPNQFLGLHSDSHVAQGWQVAYVLNFARDWKPDWGGYLLFHDEDGDVIMGYRPRFNTLNLFAVPQWHSVSYVPPFAPPGRLAISGWFRDR